VDREGKKELVATLNAVFKAANVVVVAHYSTTLNPDGVKALAALPSLDELRAKIVGLIQAPATKVAQLLNAPASKLARVVQAYASKSEAA